MSGVCRRRGVAFGSTACVGEMPFAPRAYTGGFQQVLASNPDYADAHFNLAVIYATAQPPAKELAKRHYARATSLGAQPDASLERLLH